MFEPRRFLERTLASFSPNAYGEIVEDEPFRRTFSHFLKVVLLCSVLLSLLLFVAFFVYQDVAQTRIAQFTNVTIDAAVRTDDRVVLFEKPLVVFDTIGVNLTDERLLFGEEALSYRPYYWFGERVIDYDDLRNPLEYGASAGRILALFFWPSVAIWSSLYLLVKEILLIVCCSFLGLLLPRLFAHRIPYPRAVQVGFLAGVPMVVVDFVLFSFYRSFWIPFGVYLIVYALGIAVVAEHNLKKPSKKGVWKK